MTTKSEKQTTMVDAELSLEERILQESLQLLSQVGANNLSLREVARSLKVSHSAPYRHFSSKEEVLAVLNERGFKKLQKHLEKNLPEIYDTGSLENRLFQMMKNYLSFAAKEKDLYLFLFGPRMFDKGKFPGAKQSADNAYSLLTNQLAAMQASKLIQNEKIETQCMYVFSSVHGLASLMLHGLADDKIPDEKSAQELLNFIYTKVLTGLRNPILE